MIVHSLKKGLSLLLLPSGLVFLCLFLAFFIWPLRRGRNLVRNLIILAFLIYAVAGSAPVSNYLVTGLESMTVGDAETPSSDSATTVVLLVNGGLYERTFPLEKTLTPTVQARVFKAWEVCRKQPQIKKLIITGGCMRPGNGGSASQADVAYGWLQEMGLPERVNVDLIKDACGTEASMRAAADMVGDAPFYLVTSAFHMPRTLLHAGDAGLEVLPVPCGFLGKDYQRSSWDLWPNPVNLSKSDRAVYEYLGLTWFWITHYVRLVHHKVRLSMPAR